MSNQGFDFGQVGCNSFAVAQQNANASRPQSNITAQAQTAYNELYSRNAVFRRLTDRREMTASDLGIVDQLLDDKVGMEP